MFVDHFVIGRGCGDRLLSGVSHLCEVGMEILSGSALDGNCQAEIAVLSSVWYDG
jgi:hypothetical protein